jgi:anti-anti-sigma factor
MTAMELKTTDVDGVTVVTMSGDLEVQEVDDFKTVMDEVLKQGQQPRLVLEISAVTRMTSYVVALIGFYNAQFTQAKGKFVIAGAAGPAQRALELSGLVSVVASAETLEAAIQTISN